MKRSVICYLLFVICTLSACDLSNTGTYTRTTDNSVIPGNLTRASFSDLPGWRDDDVRYALQAFRNTCKSKFNQTGTVKFDVELMREKCATMPSPSASVATVRTWFESNFQPYRAADNTSKFTGYYSPVVNACRRQTARCSAPIMDTPTDGQKYKGVDSKTLVNNRIGRVIYWIDPIDLQDMGSATLVLDDGSRVKVNVASTNDLPFNGIGGQLMQRGIKPAGGYTMKAVRAYLKEHRALANELIANNPRYVYYRVATDTNVIGSIGVPLSKIRSLAVDDSIYSVGMPTYISTTLSADGRKLNRLMIAQDTGGAIKGWVRGDIFFGVGDDAFEFAHGQSASGQMWILMPKVYSN